MEKIHLIAPGKYCGSEVIQNGVDLLTSFGFEVNVGKHAQGQSGYYSGSTKQRVEDFTYALQTPESKIFFARGGYGAIQVLESIDLKLLSRNRPLIYGYSDATVFHLKMSQLNQMSVHCPMALDAPTLSKESKEQLYKTLFLEPLKYKWNGHQLNNKGSVQSTIIGGNLAVLASMMGSKHLPDFKGKILFIEDVGEALYAVDRLMMMLQLNGILEQISGLMVGQFTSMGDSNPPYGASLEEIVLSHVNQYKYPVCFDLPIGHINNHQSIYFGVDSHLEITKEEVLLHQ
jgi:muramoyltetrapeptide carboxypeptidase